ncbi:Uma2 family endonuclease [Nodosilinea sp. LEGE 07088]|uniref:Uma2 family endonuclease n=1 Tax=Nodosilinea sp. LEGE 07088 TaxID=2777968 RepID=UPI001D141291|nr:Uma2 family endonuclease [Nodosilinea sp. LEGE 07088]
MPQGLSVVNLDHFAPPNLAIEIAKASLLDDLGAKRQLYKNLDIAEYWIVDVGGAEVLGFAIANQGSQQIRQSSVLPDFSLDVLKSALQRRRQSDQIAVGQWLMTQFQ